MSNWTPKEGAGSLFSNERKESGNHPDFKGDIMIDGKSYWLSGWKKEGKNGRSDFISLSAKPKDASKTVDKALKQVREQSQRRSENPSPESDLPFPDPDFDDQVPF